MVRNQSEWRQVKLQLSSIQPIRVKTGWKWTNENRERVQFGQSHNLSTTLQVLFSRNTHIQNNTHNHTDNSHAPNRTESKLCMHLHRSEHTADCECVCCLSPKPSSVVCKCATVRVSFTYLGKVVFVLALLEGVAVEICCLIGQLCDDGVFHLIYWVNEPLLRVQY